MDPFAAPEESAKAASLQHITDQRPGITRRRAGSGFTYRAPDGSRVGEPATLARIRALAIPPAWTDVWISPIANGHVQATGRDAKGRKQYRYHPRWRAVRDETKFERMLLFGRTLPRIRRRVRKDLARRGLPREKVLALIVRLLETTFIRVGNEEYARANGSFGLTTMRNRHVRVAGDTITFTFRGKSGKTHSVDLDDARMARLIRRARDIPGQDLFQYVDDDGEPRGVTSTDVNDYLREITGEEFTAKDFRTWAGTLLAAASLTGMDVAESKAAEVRAVALVAERLGNTVSISRKCYIHPAVLRAFTEDGLRAEWEAAHAGDRISARELAKDERVLLGFLEACGQG